MTHFHSLIKIRIQLFWSSSRLAHVIKLFGLTLQMSNRHSKSRFRSEELPARLFLRGGSMNRRLVFVKWEPL